MSGEHFLLFVALPFTVAVLGLLCRGIAKAKGRSAWWALAGFGFHISLIIVLALPTIRPPRPVKTREPVAPRTDDAAPAEREGAKPFFRPARQWRSQLMRKPREGWRSNDFLYLFELHIALLMSMMILVGTIIAIAGIYGLLTGSPITVNGQDTYSLPIRIWFTALPAGLAVLVATYLFHIRPGLIRGSERNRRRRARPKRGDDRPPKQ